MYNELINIGKDGNVFLEDDSIALIPKLWEVYKSDKLGSRMVRWIVCVYDYKSPFRRLPLMERQNRVSQLYFEKEKNPRETKLVKAAIDEYVKLQYDPLIDEYNAMCEQSFNMTQVYRDIEPTKENLEELNKMQDLMGKAAISREKLKELILKDEQSEVKIAGRGSEDFSIFENEESMNN